MSKIDASELIRQLEGRVVNLRSKLEEYQSLMDDTEDEIDKYEYLLSLVKYEEEEDSECDIIQSIGKFADIKVVDWSKVPVDTLVEVRDDFQEEWDERYFKSYVQDDAYPYKTFYSGYDSKGAEVGEVGWTQCRLYEGDE